MFYKIYCKKKQDKNFEDYYQTIIANKCDDDQFQVIHYNDSTKFMKILDKDSHHIFLYRFPPRILHFLPFFIHLKIPLYFLNTEQLSLPHHCDYIKKLHPYIQIIDYSFSNFIITNQFKKNTYYLPYSINDSEIYKNIPKTKDICMIYPGNGSVRRHNIIHLLRKNGIPVDIIKGYGRERDLQLAQYKIILNIHYHLGYKIFEEIRCNRCIYNKMIVISETSILDEQYPLKEYMIKVPYLNFVQKVKEVWKNYDKYYKELFENYDEEKIKNEYKKSYNHFFGKNKNITMV